MDSLDVFGILLVVLLFFVIGLIGLHDYMYGPLYPMTPICPSIR